jgi:hypothetical protein
MVASWPRGVTDAQGIARFNGLSPEGAGLHWRRRQRRRRTAGLLCERARARDAQGVEDMTFAWSDWNRGIEAWRFNLPTSSEAQADERAHTVFDRTLLRAGETVSMKHLLRAQTAQGLGLPAVLPATLIVTHTGSGQQYTQPLAWRKTPHRRAKRRKPLAGAAGRATGPVRSHPSLRRRARPQPGHRQLPRRGVPAARV